MPTSFESVLSTGIHGYYEVSHNLSIPKQLIDALEILLAGDAVEVWCAFRICADEIRFEVRNLSPFRIMTNDFIDKVRVAFHNNKKALQACKLFTGKPLNDGLWQDIQSINDNLVKKNGVSLL